MEILSNGPDPHKRRADDARVDLERDTKRRVRTSREDLVRMSELRADEARQRRALEVSRPPGRSDEVQISDRARILAAQVKERAAEGGTSTERLAELKAAHDAGRLNTPEAFERAAGKILDSGF